MLIPFDCDIKVVSLGVTINAHELRQTFVMESSFFYFLVYLPISDAA